jgi:response regulator RpfG family c-di-GMP phosphodiesterase
MIDDTRRGQDLLFSDEANTVGGTTQVKANVIIPEKTWKVLIVDDEQEVHILTKMVLEGFVFNRRPLEFISAYSRSEAMEVLEVHPDIALAYLDVVMEEDDSGLQLVRYIREEQKNSFIRIILRTGQPGQAPEEKVIRDYDINDYKEKTELTSRKLYTTTIAALRAYDDLMRIESNRVGLEKIIESANNLFQAKSMHEFIQGVLIQLTSILGIYESAFYCMLSSFAATKKEEDFIITAAIGDYSPLMGCPLICLDSPRIREDIAQVLQERKSHFFDNRMVLYFKTKLQSENLIYMEGVNNMETFDRELIEVFIANVSIAYDNIYLDKENEATQKEIIIGLGEIAEARSKETGRHVRRVAEFCRLLARLAGLSEDEAEVIYIASTMHDVGKVAVPDAILNKPGRLTPKEFEEIKLHATMGYEMLKKSERPVMKMAAQIALEHHEKYNGTGYPQGLVGEKISLVGRIAAVADVFDALGTSRIYKKAWPLEDILVFMQAEKGRHFDPVLVEALFRNLDKFVRIRNELGD